VLNVFRMFGKMTGERLAVESTAGLDAQSILKSGVRGQPDVSALAALGPHQLAVLVWYYHDDDLPGPDAMVNLSLTGIPLVDGSANLTHYRIDASHSNAYTKWLAMGSPVPVSDKQYAELLRAGQLAELQPAESLGVTQGAARLKFDLPRQGVSLLVLSWK